MTSKLTVPKMNIIPDKKKVANEFAVSEKTGKHEIDPRPEFSVNSEEFPEIKDWSVGKRYKILIEAEMVGSHIGEYGDDKGKLTGSFKISGIMANAYAKSTQKDEYPTGMKKS